MINVVYNVAACSLRRESLSVCFGFFFCVCVQTYQRMCRSRFVIPEGFCVQTFAVAPLSHHLLSYFLE